MNWHSTLKGFVLNSYIEMLDGAQWISFCSSQNRSGIKISEEIKGARVLNQRTPEVWEWLTVNNTSSRLKKCSQCCENHDICDIYQGFWHFPSGFHFDYVEKEFLLVAFCTRLQPRCVNWLFTVVRSSWKTK